MNKSISQRIYIVEQRPNPTIEFYLVPKFLGMGIVPVRLSHDNYPAVEELSGASVIFVRYISKKWQQFVTKHRSLISTLVYFMDDDLFDISVTKGTPLRYRFKLARFSTLRQSWLKAMDAQLWLASDFLMNKYASWNPTQVYPRAMVKKNEIVQVFYHGSFTHRADILWLYDVIKAVLIANENVTFEIIGNSDVNKLYKHLPRTTVLHPMSWQTYKYLLSQPGRKIGLAPLLDVPFNYARSYTKYFDITQAGATGIYASKSQFSEVVKNRENGMLIEMEKKLWVEAILELAREPTLRDQLYHEALNRIEHLVEHEI